MQIPLAILFICLVATLACKESRVIKTQNESRSPQQTNQTVVLRPPVVITFKPADPEYPENLRSTGLKGEVVMVFHLDKSGQISHIQKESGPDEFMQTAEIYARQLRFDVDESLFQHVQFVPFRLTIKFQPRAKK
jgi:outer membrane biosynthesis protein TonB